MLYASNGYKLVSKVFLVVSRTFRVFAMHFEVVDGALWVLSEKIDDSTVRI